MFFKGKIQDESREVCFYMPIVEQIRDYENARTWSLALQKNVARKFYCSIELLQQLESSRLGANKVLSCYKISLTSSEHSQLKADDRNFGLFTGFLSFAPESIKSLIVLNADNPIEYMNPLYLVSIYEKCQEITPLIP
ncbi:MAG: hypothetical protein QM652_06165 [Legionella sp.]|uniref:hypothetical protein n=1 Tax=Legionella sp. TaxID=459 RepID=UPI0039E2C4DA